MIYVLAVILLVLAVGLDAIEKKLSDISMLLREINKTLKDK